MSRLKLVPTLLFVAALFAAPVSPLFAAPVSPLFAQSQGPFVANVNCNAPGAKLQTFLDNAPLGATVGISGSCADGPFHVRKDVTLVGGVVHSLSAPNGSPAVLFITGGARVRMNDLRFNAQGVGTGIVVEDSSTLVAGANVLIEKAVAWAITLGQNSTLKLVESSLRYNDSGLLLSDSSHATIYGSSISDNNFFGVAVEAGSTANFGNTQINNNGHSGLFIEGLSVATIGGTTIRGNGFIGVRVEFANTGLRIRGEPSTIEGNSPIDVSCVPGSFIEVVQPVISSTKLAAIDPGCMVANPPIFAP